MFFATLILATSTLAVVSPFFIPAFAQIAQEFGVPVGKVSRLNGSFLPLSLSSFRLSLSRDTEDGGADEDLSFGQKESVSFFTYVPPFPVSLSPSL